jgi:phage-related protein
MAVTPNNNPGSNPNQLNEKELKRLIELLQKIDKLSEVAATNMASQAQSAGNARQQLGRLEENWNDITGDISYASKGFSEILQEIKNSNEGLNESVKAYRGLKSISEILQGYQQDISNISEKDIVKEKQKLEAEKNRLKTANELLVDKKKEGEAARSSLASDKARNEQDQKNQINVVVNLQNKAQKTKQDYLNLQKARKELQATNREYVSISKQIENNNKSLIKIEDTLKQNEASIGKFDALAEGVELTLQRLSKEVRFKNVEDLDKQFKNIIEEAQSTDENLSKITKSFSSISSIAQKVEDHQSGANKLSEKDAKKLLEKLESERKSLSNRYELLKLEEQKLKIDEESNRTSRETTQQEIDALEAKSSLTKDEEAQLKTLKTQYQKLLETQNDISENLDVNKKLQEKTSEYINKQNVAYNTTVNNLKTAKKEAENMRKALGLSGLAVDGIGKAFSKLGLGGLASAMGLDEAKEKMKDVADRITDGGKKTAGLVGQFQILGAGLKEIGKSLLKNLTDPVTIVTGLVTGMVSGFKSLISLFEQTAKYNGDISKTFSLSAEESSKIGDNLRSAASSDFFMNNEEARQAFDAMANATGTINSAFSDGKTVSAMNDMMTYAGYTAESAGEFYKLGQLNNKSADEMVTSLQGQLKVLQVNNKLRINEKQAVEMVAKASASVRMNLGANPKKLADAAFYASKLGMTLDEISSAAEQTLNFESAIQNQLEYQVLSGKEINIDAYQQAAASGDTAAASKELNKILEEQGGNIKGNVFAQEALAKTLGISREQMMKSLELQKVQKKVGGDIRDIEEAINNKMKKGLTFEQAAAEASKEGYASIVEQNKNAQVFSKTISEIKENFMNTIANSQEFKDLFSKENITGYVNFIKDDLMPAVKAVALGFVGIIGTLKKFKEPIKWLLENLGTISKVLLVIASIKVGANIVKGVGGLISSIKDLASGKFGKPGSRTNPLYVTPTGGGGMGLGDTGLGDVVGGKGKWAKRAGKAFKAVGLAAAAYTAYNAFSGPSEEDITPEQIKEYQSANPGVSEQEAKKQLVAQNYQTGSKTGDIALSAGEAAISYAPDLINARNATSSVGSNLQNRAQQIAEMKAKTPGLTSEEALKKIRESEKGFFSKLWDGTKNMGTKLADGAKDIGTKLVDGTKNIGTKLVDGAKNVWDGAKGISTQLLDGTKNLVSQIGTKIGELGTKLIDGVKSLAGKASELLTNMISKVGNLISNLTSKAGDLIKNAASTIANTASKVINAGKNVASTVVEKGKSLASKGVDVAKSVVSSGKSMLGKAMDWGSDLLGKGANAVKSVAGKAVDVGKSVVSKTASVAGEALEGAKNVAGKAVSWSKSKIIDPLKPYIKKGFKALGPVMTAVTSTMDAMAIIDEAKAKQAAGEQVNSGELGKKIVQKAAYPIANLALNAIPVGGNAASLVDAILDVFGVSPIRFITDNLIDLLDNDIFSGIGDLVLGKQQAQQVQDGVLDPNGGPVVSSFQKGELVPVMQGIKGDNAYLTTNKPVQQVQDGAYGTNTTTNNSAVIAAINKLADAIISNSSKEITLQMNGQTVGKVLTPIMTPMTVREINNTSVSI